MDLTELTECVKPDGNDIIADMLFQGWFGVSPSYEMSLLNTERDVALSMIRHFGISEGWKFDEGIYFECLDFKLNGLKHYLSIMVFNPDQPCRYRVSLRFSHIMKYNKCGDNLATLLYEMIKSELRNDS